MLTSLELCAGAGGQALGLEQAGIQHEGLVEIDKHCCQTLRHNRPKWNVVEEDLKLFKARAQLYRGVDIVAGGLPCPPFSVAGKQLGADDERNLFPDALEIVAETKPRAVMIENVRGFLDGVFKDYREGLKGQFKRMGYTAEWELLNASNFGVPQLRPRVVIVAVLDAYANDFSWPKPSDQRAPSVGEALREMMAEGGWPGAQAWSEHADEIAPTIVGGSKKHGGPDLGPTRARRAWETLGVNGKTLAELPPGPDHEGMPRLTVPMVARVQGFPSDWQIVGRKTNAYRQVGNAFPPPVARAVAERIATALTVRRLHAVA